METATKFETELALVKSGVRSLWSAMQSIGAEMTPEMEATLRAAHDKSMRDYERGYKAVTRVMGRGY